MKKLFCGRILTLSAPLYADAVLVEDGVISAVGRKEQLLADFDGEIIEFEGMLMPSFIDAHSHFTMNASQASQCDLRECTSIDEIAAAVRSYIIDFNVKPGDWIVANNFDISRSGVSELPKIEDVDRICPENPLVLRHKSAHMLVANTVALKIAGITPLDAEISPSTVIAKDGKLTGCLKEGAMERVTKFIPPLSVERIYSFYKKTAEMYASHGITTVQDGFIDNKHLLLYRMLNRERREFDVDIVAYVGGSRNYDRMKTEFDSFNRLSSVSIGGIKAILDGSPQLRTAWVRKPYITEDTCYHPQVEDEALVKAFEIAADNETQILVHCNGDAAIEQFLRCLELAEKNKPILKTLKPVIIHAQLMGRDQMAKAKELGAVVSFFVAHCYHWGDTHLANLGPERGMYISPVATAIKHGLPYTFHQDTPVVKCDMLETVWCAVNRITANGVRLAEGERISVLEALRAVTVNVAYQYSQEALKGTVEVGKLADFVILDKDILEADPVEIRDIKVLSTYKNGKCIYNNIQNA